MEKLKKILINEEGYAYVEATFVFPIMVFIFTALIILSLYLPTRASLQRATQFAAMIMATEEGDTWLNFNLDYLDSGQQMFNIGSKSGNVYEKLIKGFINNNEGEDKARIIVTKVEDNTMNMNRGELSVEFKTNNYIVYKEIEVTATRIIPVPVDLSIIRFPKEIPVTVTSIAVIDDGDEFLRNMDIVVDIVKNSELSGIFEKAGEFMKKATDFLK